MKVMILIVSLTMLVIMPTQVFAQYQRVRDGEFVQVNEGIVTADVSTKAELDNYNNYLPCFDFFFVQKADRSSGIQVLSSFLAWESCLVYVEGYKATLSNGDPILVPLVDDYGPHIYVPFGWYELPLPRAMATSQRMLTTGLCPKDLLTRVWGKVVKETTDAPDTELDYYYIDDGSGLETDQPDIKGLKVYDDSHVHNIGEQVAITGILSQDGFYQSYDVYSSQEPRGPATYKIAGDVITDVNAAGRTAKIMTDSGQTECTLDGNGTGHFELSLPEGHYCVSAKVPGYSTVTWPVNLNSDKVGVDFQSWPIPQFVQQEPKDLRVSPGSRLKITVWARDAEANSLPNTPITWSTDIGVIENAQFLTKSDGTAEATLVATTNKEVATVTVSCDTAKDQSFIESGTIGDPSVRMLYPFDGDAVSGVMGHEIIVSDTNEDGSDDINKYILLIDGKAYGSFSPAKYDENGELVRRPGFNTAKLTNGPHVLSAKVIDKVGNTMISNKVHLVVDNPISEFNINKTELFYDRDSNGFNFDYVANQVPWTMRIFTIEEDDTETTVWSASGNQLGPVHLTWDGKVNGIYQSELYMATIDTSQSATTMAQKVAAALTVEKTSRIRVAGNKWVKKAYLSSSQLTGAGAAQPSKLTWQMSTSGPGEILIAAVTSQFDWIDEHETYKEMRAVGNNAKKRGILPIYVNDMYWKSDLGLLGYPCGPNYGMDFWLGTKRGGNGCNIHHFYLSAHGYQVKTSGTYQNTVHFADEMVYGTDNWDSDPGTTEAFTDLHITPGMLRVIQFSVCNSMGTAAHPNNSIAKALGCRDDLSGCTFIGWVDDFKPFGPANGEGWVLGFWYYLCKDGGCSVWQAIQHLNNTNIPLYWNTIYHRLRLYTDTEAMVTWLE